MNVNERLLAEKIDPHLTAGTLSEIGAQALGHPVRAARAEVLTGGCWNRVLGVSFGPDEPELVYKINPEENQAGIIREYRVLELFAGTAMPVPRPVLIDPSGTVIPGTLLVMSRVPGAVMLQCYGRLSPESQRQISREIAGHLAALHERRGSGFGAVELEEADRHPSWPDFWLPRFDRVFEDIASRDLVTSGFLDQVGRARDGFRPHLEIGTGSTMTHYDVWSGNVMIDLGDGGARVSGFIDIPGHWADYARELSFAEMFGVADTEFYRIYTERHSLDPGFPLRKNMYNLKMHLRHITMYPDQTYYREGAEACLGHIQAES